MFIRQSLMNLISAKTSNLNKYPQFVTQFQFDLKKFSEWLSLFNLTITTSSTSLWPKNRYLFLQNLAQRAQSQNRVSMCKLSYINEHVDIITKQIGYGIKLKRSKGRGCFDPIVSNATQPQIRSHAKLTMCFVIDAS